MGPYISEDGPDTEASLIAARDAFRDTHDIIEVFGGYLAVPAGTVIVQSTTIGALTGKLRRLGHVAVPRADTAVTIGGRRHLQPWDMAYPDCWPAEGTCAGCGQVIRREAVAEPWEHTGRMPGEPLG